MWNIRFQERIYVTLSRWKLYRVHAKVKKSSYRAYFNRPWSTYTRRSIPDLKCDGTSNDHSAHKRYV
jgi:hypothetical protein